MKSLFRFRVGDLVKVRSGAFESGARHAGIILHPVLLGSGLWAKHVGRWMIFFGNGDGVLVYHETYLTLV